MISLASMQPRIETIDSKKLVGHKVKMCLADNRTTQLWQNFMPRQKEINNRVDNDLVCMQLYAADLDFKDYTMNTLHEKWAAAEVIGFDDIPYEMEAYTIPAGLYAVFHYIGAATDFADTFRYIFYTWLPASAYELDQRPHFELLGSKYKNNQPDSEEDIFIPIRLKNK
jgi:AraC family transcriptional regulator